MRTVHQRAADSTPGNVQLPYLRKKEMVDADLVMLNQTRARMRILAPPRLAQ